MVVVTEPVTQWGVQPSSQVGVRGRGWSSPWWSSGTSGTGDVQDRSLAPRGRGMAQTRQPGQPCAVSPSHPPVGHEGLRGDSGTHQPQTAAGCTERSCSGTTRCSTGMTDLRTEQAYLGGLPPKKGIWGQSCLGIRKLWRVEVVPNREPSPKMNLCPSLARQQSVLPMPLGR